MTTLIVGGDRLGNIPNVLKYNGIADFKHISGRKKGMRNYQIPQDCQLVIFLTDFVEHPLLVNLKGQCKQANVACVYCKRSCSDLQVKLDQCRRCGQCPLLSKIACFDE